MARDVGGDLDRPGFCVLAVGGYGRGLLAPGSDVDLLFLVEGGAGALEKTVERALYRLWDLKQKVGHATRSVEECLKQARADMTTRTSLLEARFILGDEALYERLRQRFDKEIVAKSANEFEAELAPKVAFTKVGEAFGAYGEKVTNPDDVPAALARAVKEVRGGRAAILHVRVTKL